MTIADAAWLATACLHRGNPSATDFSVQEIIEKAKQEGFIEGSKPGLQVHVSKHCVANKSANPARYRMLYKTTRGRRRLYKEGDECHPDRKEGRIHPQKEDLPAAHATILDWYDSVYSKQASQSIAASRVSFPNRGNRQSPDMREISDRSPADELLKMLSEHAIVNVAGEIIIPDRFRKELEIEAGTRLAIYREKDYLVLQPINKAFIHSLVGCCKGKDSLVEAREREHRMEE